MKKILLFAAAVAAVACAKEAPQTSVEVTTPVEGGKKEAITFGTDLKVTLKSQGSVDTWDATQNLYVYGFERKKNENTQVVFLDYNNPMIANVKTTSPAQDMSDAGEPVTTLKGALTVKDENGLPYYYEGNKTYDFFAYYIDDLNATPKVVADGIYVPVVLTGGEDVMVAKANPKEDTKGTEIENNPRYAYSAYAARRGVQPTLKFEHQLVQFKFNIKSGSQDAEKLNLKVTGLTLDALNMGDLYVVGETLGFHNVSATKATLNLFGFNGYMVPNEGAEAEGIGDCIMVIPNTVNGPLNAEDTFSGKLYLTQDAKKDPTPVEFTLKFSEVAVPQGSKISAFEAGYSFDVTITVYSLEEIEATAELTQWVNGGNLGIDTDKAPEF